MNVRIWQGSIDERAFLVLLSHHILTSIPNPLLPQTLLLVLTSDFQPSTSDPVMVHAGVAVHDIGTAYINPDKYADSLSIVAFWPSC